MPRSTTAKPILTTRREPASPTRPSHRLTDAERMARGRAQVVDGDYIEGDELGAFLDSLKIPVAKV